MMAKFEYYLFCHKSTAGRGGEYFTKFSIHGSSHNIKNGPNWIYGFIKMMGQKDQKPMKWGSTGSKIKNIDSKWFKTKTLN